MPNITKQSNSKPTHRVASIRERIRPVGETSTGIKLNVYGRGKTGKTRLACSFPKPLLLMGTEDGTKSVAKVSGVDFVRLQGSDDLDELLELLGEGKYKSAVLDHGGGLQDMILKEILGLDDIPVQRSWGMAERSHWMACGAQWKERLSRLLNLADTIGLHVVVIAHERNFSEESTSDVMVPSVGSALTPTVAAWLNGACDYIGQTYIREQQVEKDIKADGKTIKRKVSTGQKEYCLRVGAHEVFMTGFRLPEGVVLPDSIVNPTYAKIQALIDGKPLPK